MSSVFGLLGHFERDVDLDPQVSNRTLDFRVSEQQRDRPQVPRLTLDQRRLCSSQGGASFRRSLCSVGPQRFRGI
jgi:hypothetical protein